jgi:hypothetical protein
VPRTLADRLTCAWRRGKPYLLTAAAGATGGTAGRGLAADPVVFRNKISGTARKPVPVARKIGPPPSIRRRSSERGGAVWAWRGFSLSWGTFHRALWPAALLAQGAKTITRRIRPNLDLFDSGTPKGHRVVLCMAVQSPAVSTGSANRCSGDRLGPWQPETHADGPMALDCKASRRTNRAGT